MTVLLTAPILLTLTLLVSGLAKLGARRGTEDAMTSLRLPLRSFHRSVASVLPVAEIVLALALWVPFVPLQVMVAVVIALLMFGYLGIIARALTFEEQVECSCFGSFASPTVSKATLGRNVLLAGMGVLAVVAASSGLMTAALVRTPLALVGLGVALLAAIVLTMLTLGGTAKEAAGTSGRSGTDRAVRERGVAGTDPTTGEHGNEDENEDEMLDYERSGIPGGVLQQPGGALITLSQLTAHRAALLVFVSEGCGPCERVLDHAAGWIEKLSPFMQVRFVFSRPVDQLRERTTQRVGEHVMHDLQFTARTALGGRSAPSAVLLGADGLLAGGPVQGGSAVIEFVEEILEQLAGAQADGELAGPV
ncbi:MauE/DoxX family redox-associated membrane protein [Brachybacterium sp.]|uniref:MauE/DoxX family redox-associated membrane protein n=1 Tax=Brachybacterium sp. TaxID=1891286 RepID=UPI002ED13448